MLAKQKGVTLLEVLVGFVIFTSALVAVLEYVSSQIYRGHLSSSSLDKVQMTYELSTFEELGVVHQAEYFSKYEGLNWSMSSSIMDTFSSNRNEESNLLKRNTFTVVDNKNAFNWTVLKFN